MVHTYRPTACELVGPQRPSGPGRQMARQLSSKRCQNEALIEFRDTIGPHLATTGVTIRWFPLSLLQCDALGYQRGRTIW